MQFRKKKLQIMLVLVLFSFCFSGCKNANTVGVIFRGHFDDFQKHYSLLQSEMKERSPATQEGRSEIIEQIVDNENLILMEYALQSIVERMDTQKERELALQCKNVINQIDLISFFAENYNCLSDDQKQELEELYAVVFEQKNSFEDGTNG